ncbi:hypothetical protein [uncultured Ruminococcus sp.]|nr:hypothetical protein [uncultured Ruminococcus sp.]
MKYYTIEIANIRFGNVRRMTIIAESREKALKLAVIHIGERIVAAWEV